MFAVGRLVRINAFTEYPSYLVQLNISDTGYPELTRPRRLVTLRRWVPRDNSSQCCNGLFHVSFTDITRVKRFQKFYYLLKGLSSLLEVRWSRFNNVFYSIRWKSKVRDLDGS